MLGIKNVTLGALVGAAGIAAGAGLASAAELPANIAWTAYDVGSSGYNQAIGIGSALRNKMGVTLRVLPGKNDVSRLAPLREDKVQFSAFGIGGYAATEGALEFGRPEWGPQKLRMLSMSNSGGCNLVIFAGDLGVKSYADMKGLRMPVVKGAPALNSNLYGYIRFAGLEWSDLKLVEYGGYGASLDGIVEGRTDAGMTHTTSGFATKASASPRGATYVPTPWNDEEGWKRMNEAAPWFYKAMCSEGAGIEKPFEGSTYPYLILIAYESREADMAYAMTKAMFDLYPEYKDSAPGTSGWALEKQNLEWVLPMHEGAVRYYKEVGKWPASSEAHRNTLLERENVIHAAWSEFTKSAPSDEAAFSTGWQKARAAALDAKGLSPIWREW